MSEIYFWGTLVPVLGFALVSVTLISYLFYKLHITDYFLWFGVRPIKETCDYHRILNIILKIVTRDIAEKHLSAYALSRIEGAAEKSVPQIRRHKRIEVQLPQLYQIHDRWVDVKVEIELKQLKGANWLGCADEKHLG